jgi:hypothetical protein
MGLVLTELRHKDLASVLGTCAKTIRAHHARVMQNASDLAILRWQQLMEQALTGVHSQVMPSMLVRP